MRMLGLNVNPLDTQERQDRLPEPDMFRRRRPSEDFGDEIDVHLALETERLIDDGMPADEARLAARRTFGNVTAAHEKYYESRRFLWLDHLRQDAHGAV